MPNLTPQPRSKIVKALTRVYSWHHLREGGSHTIFAKPGVPEVIALPRHREISAGVIRNMCRVLGTSVGEFMQTLRHC